MSYDTKHERLLFDSQPPFYGFLSIIVVLVVARIGFTFV